MADFAPNYTNRFYVRYRALGQTHKAMFRYGTTPSAPSGDFITRVLDFIGTLAPLLYSGFTFLGVGYTRAGDGGEIPLGVTLPAAIGSSGAGESGDRPRFFSFVGRSDSGNAARVYIYGVAARPASDTPLLTNDYRLTSTENGAVANAVDALNTLEDLTAADGQTVVWYPYANIGYNGYYQRKARNA